MKQEIITLAPKILTGIMVRTNNQLERDSSTAQIPSTFGRYLNTMQQKLLQLISMRAQRDENKDGAFNDGTRVDLVSNNIYAVYAEYESDCNGIYTYFVGQEINSLEGLEELRELGLHTIHSKGQRYVKFISDTGQLPKVCQALWQHIWSLSAQELGGKRSYMTDFEIYNIRAQDLVNADCQEGIASSTCEVNTKAHAMLEIYIGIE